MLIFFDCFKLWANSLYLPLTFFMYFIQRPVSCQVRISLSLNQYSEKIECLPALLGYSISEKLISILRKDFTQLAHVHDRHQKPSTIAPSKWVRSIREFPKHAISLLFFLLVNGQAPSHSSLFTIGRLELKTRLFFFLGRKITKCVL